MTTTVKIEAHCPDDIEVVIFKSDKSTPLIGLEINKIQNGQTYETYVYDSLLLTVYEKKKE